MIGNIQEAKARGGSVIAVTVEGMTRSRANGLPWSARRALARPRYSSSPSDFTTRSKAASCSTASILRRPDPADVRQRIAMVPQDVVIFAASARDNLRYGNWNATEEQLWQAARDANAEEFLRALPEGLDTFMGEGGARLSGGQRQRIAIARALLRDAPYCCSTRRPRRSTPKASGWCRTRSTG